jgi:DNA-binding beta-propeller fold protein YncE
MRIATIPCWTLAGFFALLTHATVTAATAPPYVLLSDKPAEAATLADDLSVVNRFRIAANFTEAALGPGGDRLYVLYNGLFGPDGHVLREKGRLRVYETATGKLLAEHQLGWDSRGLLFSPDWKYLVLVSRGWQYAEKQPDPDGLLMVVDTSSLQTVASTSIGRLLVQALFTPDGSRLIALTGGRIYRKQPKRPSDYDIMGPCVADHPIKDRQTVEAGITVLAPPDFRAAGALKVDDSPAGMAFAGDGKMLVLVDRGMAHWKTKNQEMGSVQVVDFSGLKLLGRSVSGAASLVASSASNAGEFFVVSATRFNDCRLQMSQWVGGQLEDYPNFGAQPGWPYSAVPVSNGRRLIVSLMRDCNRFAGLRNQVAIVNLAAGKVEREVGIGRKGVRVAKLFGEIALLATFTLPTMVVNAAIGLPQTIKAPGRIWITEDEALAFVLDTDSNDVTALEIDTGKVLGRVAVGGGPLGLLGTPRGALLAVSRYQLTWMTPQSGKMEGQHMLSEGESISAAFSDERGKRVVLLTDKGVLTWRGDRPGAPHRANTVRGGRMLLTTM